MSYGAPSEEAQRRYRAEFLAAFRVTSASSPDGMLRFNGVAIAWQLFPPGARFEYEGKEWEIITRLVCFGSYYFRAEEVTVDRKD